MGRAPCCEKVGLKRGRWTADEDEVLIKYIQENGEGSWRSLPKNAGLLRCGKSCRLRWINYLRADLKRGNFTKEEEETIINLQKSVGNRWSFIASHLPGRTDNEVKNYWNSHLSRKIYTFKSSNGSLTASVDVTKLANTCKKRGGPVSRSVAKKYNKSKRSNSQRSGPKRENDAANETQEFTATENAKEYNARVAQNDESSGIQEITETEKGKIDKTPGGQAQKISWDENMEMKVADIFEKVERGSTKSLHDSCREVLPGTNFGTPKKLEGKNVLVPHDEANDATTVHGQIVQSGLSDLKEIAVKNKERENGTMAPEGIVINQENDCATRNSNSDTGRLDDCFSPLNSCFEDELGKLDLDAAALDFGVGDEGHDFLLWV